MNYYDVLEVEKTATGDEIKKSYRRMSLKYHPDKNQNNPEFIEKFQKINEAYETLGDAGKKQMYDLQSGMGIGNHGFAGFSGLDSIFEKLFGNRDFEEGMDMPNIRIFHNGMPIHVQQMEKPPPIIKNISIDIEKVLGGGKMPIEIERWIIENGLKIFETETIYVDIPKGIDDNELILLKGKGNVNGEKNTGDIKLFVRIENNTDFQRNGLDLIYEKTISLRESLCGFSFELNYINGKSYTINNTPGNIIPPNFKKVIQKMGLERSSHVGNLIIVFNVKFPSSISSEQMDLLNKIF